ncbi:unnamed protein product [Rotaria socialis]|uniref:RBR-type E3 ubiquitin transferase n=2 Tax=Rotaria socialis TaxID=392032 RepID=A0A820P2B9_9BILA|nr:unnamed protein product [Rotaria socialis]CAF3403328.1 unnamed protein product [Rotaria socialis]CAF3517508.1 unnamed protein product [Rotaria socialis]CAF3621204.1 unnamed protein product [Rotaria socialis]CAF3676438.1 unnamed protein product [Rotaria socialis]
MSGNEYESGDATDDDCYESYYDDTDPFQDDNNNNYTTNMHTNDPEQFEYNISTLLDVQTRFEPSTFSSSYIHTSSTPGICSICFKNQANFESVVCNHAFCHDCWSQYIDTKFQYQNCINYECMKCDNRIPHNFVLKHLSSDKKKELYKRLVVRAMIQNNPQMTLCPGTCDRVFEAIGKPIPGKVECELCGLKFCFQCSLSYHAPASCDIMRNWFKKCRDDSETANYISANTKDCPKCKVCIEKNGGCNHMSCFSCNHHFCWMCLGDWKTHENNYYECSKYRGQPQSQLETIQSRAREALKKYLHYFERWDNHQRSLKLEEQTRAKLLEKIEQNINAQNGTYIDWQYLEKAADSLAKARYTLMYTYPYAYYQEDTVDRNLFENIQAQLEVEIENLSYQIERSTTHNRGDIENQRHIVERRRQTLLLKYFPKSNS